ncbi:diguanylate cyclase and serine/threonine protein kinase with TPR repeats [Chloroherpeton thalassium ATCC 35110]|uniref:diguanylate cyclase n=1 Tax=Chloroherpeton thalassium (strain ATCC 35110 / GB-78) TaxID=517418 RepID=B3QU32_CHLT3|nr:tetratricopeptide repeat-containing diguanylate cyclase [Chloroherpeton thalassium]ACF12830.1 diguanylate cyclase and serine/threonine protein kinase with TPR repeats [Chloroherpeton thalassium ATCC 35110]
MPNGIQELESKLQQATNDEEKIELLSELAWHLVNINPKRGGELSQEAYLLAQTIGYTYGIAKSLRAQAACLSFLSQYRAALEKAELAVGLFRQLKDTPGLALAKIILAECDTKLGLFKEAIEMYTKAYKLYEILGERCSQTTILTSMGKIFQNIGDYEKAVDYHLKALSLDPDKDSLNTAGVLSNLADVYFALGKYKTSLDYLTRAIHIYKLQEHLYGITKCLGKIGDIYLTLNQLDKAEEFYTKSFGCSYNFQDKEGQASCLISFGKLYIQKCNYEKAEKSFRAGYEAAQKISHKHFMAEAKLGLGRVRKMEEKWDEAIEHFNYALTLGKELNLHNIVFESHRYLCLVFEKLEDYKAALEHHKLFYAVKTKIFSEEAERKTKNLLLQHELEEFKREAEIYRLKNVELVSANENLEVTTLALKEANAENQLLLERLREQAETLERLVTYDGLTGLANRRHFDEQFEYEFRRTRRYKRPLSIAMSDIDFFKKVNDNFSHQVGDEVLKKVASIFRENVRAGDLVARYGGEEFVFIFTETNKESAIRAAEKIRKAIEDYDWSNVHAGLKVTISIGVAEDAGFDGCDELIAAADSKLYEAKRNGRNQVRA